MTERQVTVFHLKSHLNDTLAHKGLFPLVPNFTIIEPREALVLTRMSGHDMVEKTVCLKYGVEYNNLNPF